MAVIFIPRNFDNVKGVKDSIVRAPHLVGNPGRKETKRNVINTMSISEPKRITYGDMLKDRRVLMAAISAGSAMILMFFFDSILSDHLLEIGVSDKDIGSSLLNNPIRLLLRTDMLLLRSFSSFGHMGLQTFQKKDCDSIVLHYRLLCTFPLRPLCRLWTPSKERHTDSCRAGTPWNQCLFHLCATSC